MVQQLTSKERRALHMNAADSGSMRVCMAIDRENQGGTSAHWEAVRTQVVVNRAIDALWQRHHDGATS
jgi:predicted NAD-dependent protein-ADP-ribosyltransferase YbiA (DUF1768 family)